MLSSVIYCWKVIVGFVFYIKSKILYTSISIARPAITCKCWKLRKISADIVMIYTGISKKKKRCFWSTLRDCCCFVYSYDNRTRLDVLRTSLILRLCVLLYFVINNKQDFPTKKVGNRKNIFTHSCIISCMYTESIQNLQEVSEWLASTCFS